MFPHQNENPQNPESQFVAHFALNAKVNAVAGNLPLAQQETESDEAFGKRLAEVSSQQISFIDEEFRELLAGWAKRDVREMRDGLADLIVTIDGWLYRICGGEQGRLYDSEEIDETEISEYALIAALVSHMGEIGEWSRCMEDTINPHVCLGLIERELKNMLLITEALSNSLGFDLLADQRAVFESNMSKFDTIRADAELGVAKYAVLGVEVVITETEYAANNEPSVTYYVLRTTQDQTDVKGRFIPKGKFLKSVRFRAPVFAELCKTEITA